MQLAEVLKTLDLELELDNGALVTDVLVVAKVQRFNGATTVVHCVTEGTDWVTAMGLVTAAHRAVTTMEGYESE